MTSQRNLTSASTVRALGLFLVPALLAITGCGTSAPALDPSQLASLYDLNQTGQAVVRLYAAPIPGIEGIATHPWFVVKHANWNGFNRWEVWQDAGYPYGHVRLNLQYLEDDVGAGGATVVAELVGPAAESVVSFIESQSPFYPCQNYYEYFPGPNSNSYAQWVLDNTGWQVTLPSTSIGADVPANCQ
ncbi:MAG TPA: DUF3750 domain-containing protein [Phycisphaerae bacterium]|nr:DUF3750 domain-containing protein [Phycisphaerae bacterium]